VSDEKIKQQASVVPFRRRDDTVELCLITSRTQGNWCFPKGTIEAGETAAEAGLREAFEEAGITGKILGDPLGQYDYLKKKIPRRVTVMLMEVTQCDDAWAEMDRSRQWINLDEASSIIDSRKLRPFVDLAQRQIIKLS